MRKIVITFAILALVSVWAANTLVEDQPDPDKIALLKEKIADGPKKAVDHSLFEELNKEFYSPEEVTAACITCHNGRHKEVMQSAHWNWEREEYIEGRGVVFIGKKNVINNYCIGIGGSEKSCNSCHIGYGWEDKSFDFSDTLKVDCLACHDNSGTYIKGKAMAGMPAPGVDLKVAATSVGKPQMDNCGSCHFYGGGGNNVKHGDLEEALYTCSREVDVHMSAEGGNIDCVACHTADNHNMKGQLYSVSSENKDRADCESCHTTNPHKDELINEHTIKVSCQACHIPMYAKVNATKMTWDWSTAGKLKNGMPYEEEDNDGNVTYKSTKGTFTWGKNLKPEYIWFNGTADHYIAGDKVDTDKPVKLNSLKGDYKDKNSKIMPVKIHRGKQIYDPNTKMLIQPKLYAEDKGQCGFWLDFNWDSSAKAGMDYLGLPYSGEYKFVESEMYWPLNHMVSPVEETVKCEECHTREDSRLANLKDFYMPGRDFNAGIDLAGKSLLIVTMLAIMTHATIRIISSRRKNK